MTHADIRAALEPRIRERGIAKTARDAGIPESTLSAWLAKEGTRRRDLTSVDHLDRIARVFGLEITLGTRKEA